MTIDDIVAAVYLRLGVPAGDALLTSAVVQAAVLEALNEINSEQEWPWFNGYETYGLVAGQSGYAIPGVSLRSREVRIIGDVPMERMSIEELDDKFPFTDSETGRPVAYALENGSIEYRPIPDSEYQVEHRFAAVEQGVTTGDDTPTMPAQFHPAIACLAAHIVLGRSREDARAGGALSDYQRWAEKMRRFKRQYKGPARIRSQWDTWG